MGIVFFASFVINLLVFNGVIMVLYGGIGITYLRNFATRINDSRLEMSYWSCVAWFAWLIVFGISVMSLGFLPILDAFTSALVIAGLFIYIIPMLVVLNYQKIFMPLKTLKRWQMKFNQKKENKIKKAAEKEAVVQLQGYPYEANLAQSSRWIEQAIKYYNEGNYSSAIDNWQKAIAEYETILASPENPSQRVKIRENISILKQEINNAVKKGLTHIKGRLEKMDKTHSIDQGQYVLCPFCGEVVSGEQLRLLSQGEKVSCNSCNVELSTDLVQ